MHGIFFQIFLFHTKTKLFFFSFSGPLDNAIYSQSPLIMQNKVLHVAGHSMGNRPHMVSFLFDKLNSYFLVES